MFLGTYSLLLPELNCCKKMAGPYLLLRTIVFSHKSKLRGLYLLFNLRASLVVCGHRIMTSKDIVKTSHSRPPDLQQEAFQTVPNCLRFIVPPVHKPNKSQKTFPCGVTPRRVRIPTRASRKQDITILLPVIILSVISLIE